MPKRKRSYEPSLEEKLERWQRELARGMKTAKGFERQRLSKRIREAQADAAKVARLEREVAVLKSLDLQQAAHAHLSASLLKIKGVAEAPRLPREIVKSPPKPEGLSEEERAALHNVTSALCNRKQVRDVIDEAVVGTCVVLRVPMPDRLAKKGSRGDKSRGKRKESEGEEEEDEEKSDEGDNKAATVESGKRRGGREEEDESSDSEEQPEPVLLKRKRDKPAENEEELDSDEDDELSEEEPFEGFSDSDAEERAFSRYDEFVAGSSSDEDEDEDESDENSSDDELAADSRAHSFRKATSATNDPDISLSSDPSASASPPPKKPKTAKPVPGKLSAGSSAFLPTLMGGYISGSESDASSLSDDGPPRKNRRGQRARQAIWEKKYKDKARHVQQQQRDKNARGKGARDQGWDMRRGAVGEDDGEGGAGSSGRPWKQGISDPFANQHVHPDRQRQMQSTQTHSMQNRAERRKQNVSARDEGYHDKPQPKAVAPPKRDDTGPLHPSWAAAKKAKEEGQKIAFQGKKVVFD
ncbi:hypothetical protein AAE478_007679 [Parahypoxylon ruwenzoriense]